MIFSVPWCLCGHFFCPLLMRSDLGTMRTRLCGPRRMRLLSSSAWSFHTKMDSHSRSHLINENAPPTYLRQALRLEIKQCFECMHIERL